MKRILIIDEDNYDYITDIDEIDTKLISTFDFYNINIIKHYNLKEYINTIKLYYDSKQKIINTYIHTINNIRNNKYYKNLNNYVPKIEIIIDKKFIQKLNNNIDNYKSIIYDYMDKIDKYSIFIVIKILIENIINVKKQF